MAGRNRSINQRGNMKRQLTLAAVIALLLTLVALPGRVVAASTSTCGQTEAGTTLCVNVNAPDSVVAGDTITFHVTVSDPAYRPTNGSQKIQLRSGTSTLAYANYTVIPMTTNVDGSWDFSFRTSSPV